MRSTLRKLFSPILSAFEGGDEPFNYKASHRTILIAVGSLFMLLSLALAAVGLYFETAGALFPFLIFFAVGSCALVVGGLGNDRAVAKIWGNK